MRVFIPNLARAFVDDSFQLRRRLSLSKADLSQAIKPGETREAALSGRASPPGKCDPGKTSLEKSRLSSGTPFALARVRVYNIQAGKYADPHTHTCRQFFPPHPTPPVCARRLSLLASFSTKHYFRECEQFEKKEEVTFRAEFMREISFA